jgi:phospholipase C
MPHVDHVVVLALENRSFDHMLGFAPLSPPFDGLISSGHTACHTLESQRQPKAACATAGPSLVKTAMQGMVQIWAMFGEDSWPQDPSMNAYLRAD